MAISIDWGVHFLGVLVIVRILLFWLCVKGPLTFGNSRANIWCVLGVAKP